LPKRVGATATVDAALLSKERWQQAITKLKAHVAAHHGDTPLKLTLRYPEADLKLALKQPVALTDAFLHGLCDLPFASTEVSFELFRTNTETLNDRER
jgi:hypothetical protein